MLSSRNDEEFVEPKLMNLTARIVVFVLLFPVSFLFDVLDKVEENLSRFALLLFLNYSNSVCFLKVFNVMGIEKTVDGDHLCRRIQIPTK